MFYATETIKNDVLLITLQDELVLTYGMKILF